MEELDKIVEKIKRLASGGNDTDMVCFIVAFDLLYFLNETDNRNKFVYNYYKNDNSMFSANLKKVCIFAESIILEDEENCSFNSLILKPSDIKFLTELFPFSILSITSK